MMGMFCPIIKDECKTTECKMWEQDECIIIKYMITRNEAFEREKKRFDRWEGRPKPEVPVDLRNLEVEELAQKVVDAHNKEYPLRIIGPRGDACYFPSRPRLGYGKTHEYLGVPRHLPYEEPDRANLERKIQKIEELANKKLCKAYDVAYSAEFEKEMKDLQSLTTDVFTWAAAQRLEELKPGDLDVFLMEKNLRLLHEVKTKLINQVNLRLKTQ